MSRAFLTLLFIIFSFSPVYAIAIPPAAIDENAVVPECVSVQPSYLFGQGQVYGSDGKGPAIRIENGCAAPVTIENVSTGAGAESLQPVSSIDAGRLADKELLTKAEPFIFVPKNDGCTAARAAHQNLQDGRMQKIAEQKAQLDNAASAEELLEQLQKTPVEKPDARKITCGGITLQPGGLVVLAMPWETAYLVTGSPDVKIAGQMINPLDVNSPDTFQYAQNGDKVTRYMLALHNIETGQNLKLSLRWLNEAAEQGYRPAIYQLANCYLKGHCGVAKNETEAGFWWMLAGGEAKLRLSPAEDKALGQRLAHWRKTHPEVTDY